MMTGSEVSSPLTPRLTIARFAGPAAANLSQLRWAKSANTSTGASARSMGDAVDELPWDSEGCEYFGSN